ncbi:GL13879 [Drosophila persimilis]|uniref:Defense protein 3 n=2 Tax=pseudoobscura subgroup TaxID=32358 RepID=A0A6I8UM51_DROPS|nr:putative defense protein 3 [Drosophila pseudoobscura]XP_002020245.1 putative defense protein 3 [Drosophila persimilis]XP_017143946.2 putative defense protein 3 [Drosophila miranda]EDW39057.1 GL13879 [Drosophila persimilis]
MKDRFTRIAQEVPSMLLIMLLPLLIGSTAAFPDGAPADTCVKQRANQPNHGKARTQPAHTNPFEVVADAQSYHPGQQISVVIYPHAQQSTVFRGFFLQARDAHSNEWIGEWVQSENTKTIPECSAITHSDNRDKLGAKLLWKAPQNKRGNVYFTGTVLQEYGTFWSDIVNKVQAEPQ